MTKLCKVKGFHGFVGGKDNDNVFEEGTIYSAKRILGEIILTPIGKQPKYDNTGNKIEMLCLEEIIITVNYLLS